MHIHKNVSTEDDIVLLGAEREQSLGLWVEEAQEQSERLDLLLPEEEVASHSRDLNTKNQP